MDDLAIFTDILGYSIEDATKIINQWVERK